MTARGTTKKNARLVEKGRAASITLSIEPGCILQIDRIYFFGLLEAIAMPVSAG
jgi:hypothetical protein